MTWALFIYLLVCSRCPFERPFRARWGGWNGGEVSGSTRNPVLRPCLLPRTSSSLPALERALALVNLIASPSHDPPSQPEGFQYMQDRLITTCQGALNGLHITLGTPAPFAQHQWASLPREFQTSKPDIRGHAGGKGSNVCLHCVPITLQWSWATIYNMCDMCICLGAIGLPYNGMLNTKAGIMCWYSCMSGTRGIRCLSRICQLWRHIGPIQTPFSAGNFLCQGHDERQWIGPATRLCEDGRSWMADDSWQIINPTTLYGQICRVTMIDNQENNWIWWCDDAKGVAQNWTRVWNLCKITHT